jgi:hypothetical protein
VTQHSPEIARTVTATSSKSRRKSSSSSNQQTTSKQTVSTTPKNVVDSNSQAQSASSSPNQRTEPIDRYRQSRLAVSNKPESFVRARQNQISTGIIKPTISKDTTRTEYYYEEAKTFIQRTASTGYSGLDSSGQGMYFSGERESQLARMTPTEKFTQQIGSQGLQQMGYTPVSTTQGERYVKLEQVQPTDSKFKGNVIEPYKPVHFAKTKTYASDFVAGFKESPFAPFQMTFGGSYSTGKMQTETTSDFAERKLAYTVGSISNPLVQLWSISAAKSVGSVAGGTIGTLSITPVGEVVGGIGLFALGSYALKKASVIESRIINKEYWALPGETYNIGFDVARMSAYSQGIKQGLAKSDFVNGGASTSMPSNYKYKITSSEVNIGGKTQTLRQGYIAEYRKPTSPIRQFLKLKSSQPSRVVSFSEVGGTREIIGQDLKTGMFTRTVQDLYSGRSISTMYQVPKGQFNSGVSLDNGFIGQKVFIDKSQSQMLVPIDKSWSAPSYAEIMAYQNQPTLKSLTLFDSTSPTIVTRNTRELFDLKSQNLAYLERSSSKIGIYESKIDQPSTSLWVKKYNQIQSETVSQIGISTTETFKQTDLIKQVGTGERYNLDTGLKMSTGTSMIKTKSYPQFEIGGEVSSKKMFDYTPRKDIVSKLPKELRGLDGITPLSAVKVSQTTTTSIGAKREISSTKAYLIVEGQTKMVPKYRSPLFQSKKASAQSYDLKSLSKPKTTQIKIKTQKIDSEFNTSFDLGKMWQTSGINLTSTRTSLGLLSMVLIKPATLTKTESRSKLNNLQILNLKSNYKMSTSMIPATRVQTAQVISPIQISTPRTQQLSATSSLGAYPIQQLGFSSSLPVRTPTPKLLDLPSFGWGKGSRSDSRGKGFGFGSVRRYTPSLVAYEFKIRGKRKSDTALFTGFEVRPL